MTARKSSTTRTPRRRSAKAAATATAKRSSTSRDRQQPEVKLSPPDYYLNRELSWLQFNARVLHQAIDERTPLLERLKFLAIFTSNLDEFFMVRVAAIKQQIAAGVTKKTPDGLTPPEQLDRIFETLHPMVAEQQRCFEQQVRPALEAEGIRIRHYSELTAAQKQYLKEYFESRIFPVLTPLAVDPAHPFPYISNLSLNLAVVVADPNTEAEHFARIKVPSSLPRFVPLQTDTQFVPIEDVIAHNLRPLFNDMTVKEYYPFRITRNADLEIEEEEADDLLQAIEKELRRRQIGKSAVRMEVTVDLNERIRERLKMELELQDRDIYEVDGLMDLGALMGLMKLDFPRLKDMPWSPVVPPRLQALDRRDDGSDIFAEIRTGDLLVHHPYDSFHATVLRFIERAAIDPQVMTIKQTLYRTSGDSPVIKALIRAAELGKQVAVLVELKARFDEENNIVWAKKLERAGVHVVYGLVGLKTHTKILQVVRQEGDRLRTYFHIGTGNYNPKTASLYTDLGVLSCDEDIGADMTDLFNVLTGVSRQSTYRKLLIAPTTLRSRMVELIRREIKHQSKAANNGSKGGRIIAKMNALVDPYIISVLYEAGKAGVEIDLIVRGICCLRPGVPGLSETIRVSSIIGRFLEHSRIFWFGNGGDDELYIGSADWMTRNLDRRVEAVTPVIAPKQKQYIQDMLGVMLADNCQAWNLHEDGSYTQRQPAPGEAPKGTHATLIERAMQQQTES
ncbi:MAG: RNA degradosome polyphosphate kinase [Cyanobacteria bacterium P01_F01_bin.33]